MKPYTLHDAEGECRAAMRAGDWQQVAAHAAALDRLDTPPQPVPLGAAALWYVQQGLHVFPISPLRKVPYPGTRGCKDATDDAEQVQAWWVEHPDANVGIATGHAYDVVDFDGARAHVAWSQVHGQGWAELAPCATVSTPRPGGLHLYVPASGSRNKAGVYPGVDYRGAGGYVLAPPSVLDAHPGQHPGTYRFLRPFGAFEP